MIGQINPFLPLPTPEPVSPPPPPVPQTKLSPKTISGIQASYGTPDAQGGAQPVPPAPPKGTAQATALKPGWGGGS